MSKAPSDTRSMAGCSLWCVTLKHWLSGIIIFAGRPNSLEASRAAHSLLCMVFFRFFKSLSAFVSYGILWDILEWLWNVLSFASGAPRQRIRALGESQTGPSRPSVVLIFREITNDYFKMVFDTSACLFLLCLSSVVSLAFFWGVHSGSDSILLSKAMCDMEVAVLQCNIRDAKTMLHSPGSIFQQVLRKFMWPAPISMVSIHKHTLTHTHTHTNAIICNHVAQQQFSASCSDSFGVWSWGVLGFTCNLAWTSRKSFDLMISLLGNASHCRSFTESHEGIR